MPKKPTPADTQVILEIYDLRREPEMRKARHFMTADFWPQSAADIIKLAQAFPGQENAWMRQVGGYWDMVASLVLNGGIHEALFYEPGICGEMMFLYAKFAPYIKEVREQMQNPRMMANIERAVMRSKRSREIFAMVQKNVERVRQMRAGK